MGSEREQIVEWLRDEVDLLFQKALDRPNDRIAPFLTTRAIGLQMASEAIERGDHLTTERTDNG